MSLYFGSAIFLKFFFNSFPIETPDLTSLNLEQAKGILKKGDLEIEVGGEDFSSLAAGKIYSQMPEPGKKIKKGRTIRVWTSKGRKQITIPDFSGMDLFDAKVIAEKQGLVIKQISYTKKNNAYNKVITSDPAPGTTIFDSNMVSFLVSLPDSGDLIRMPELLGLDFREAKKTLRENNLVLGNTEYLEGSGFDYDIVIDASIQAGERVKPGTVVNLTISR
jgi:serine/threonine-protein kinase